MADAAPGVSMRRGAAASEDKRLRELIVRVGRGDRAAFEALYLATSGKLLGVVTRILRSRTEAEEVL